MRRFRGDERNRRGELGHDGFHTRRLPAAECAEVDAALLNVEPKLTNESQRLVVELAPAAGHGRV